MFDRSTNRLATCASIPVIAWMAGCTYQTVPVGPVEADVAVDATAMSDVAGGYLIAFADDDLVVEPDRFGQGCNAHRYPVSAGAGLRQAIGQMFDGKFTRPIPLDALPAVDDPAADFYVGIGVESLTAQLGFSPGTWKGTAYAETHLSLEVTIYDHLGAPVETTVVSGAGSKIAGGGCGAGSVALAEASAQAITESLEEVAYRVLTSERLQRFVEQDEKVASNSQGSN